MTEAEERIYGLRMALDAAKEGHCKGFPESFCTKKFTELKPRIIAMKEEGKNGAEIARILSVSSGFVSQTLRDAK